MRLSRSNFMAPRVSCFNFHNDTKFPRMRTYCMGQMEGVREGEEGSMEEEGGLRGHWIVRGMGVKKF